MVPLGHMHSCLMELQLNPLTYKETVKESSVLSLEKKSHGLSW